MGDIFSGFQDYQHVLFAVVGVIVYFKWQEKKKELQATFDEDRKSHRDLTEEVIRGSLANGIGTKMREIISDHEKVEAMNLQRVLDEIRNEKNNAHREIEHRLDQIEECIGRPRARRRA